MIRETFIKNGNSVDLWCGDFNEILPEFNENKIDLIYTDPPYPKQYKQLYFDLGKHSQRILKVGGSLLMIIPHYSIHEILPEVSKYLKWRWLMCMWQNASSHPRMAMGIEVTWKPIGWWVKEKWPNERGFVKDSFETISGEKKLHKWQQNMEWSNYLLKFSKPGDVILDPMMCTGTVGVTCVQNNRDFIGVEIDKDMYDIAKERILS